MHSQDKEDCPHTMGLGLTFFAVGSLVESKADTDSASSLLCTLEEEEVRPEMRAGSVVDLRVLVVVVGMTEGVASSSISVISPAHSITYMPIESLVWLLFKTVWVFKTAWVFGTPTLACLYMHTSAQPTESKKLNTVDFQSVV